MTQTGSPDPKRAATLIHALLTGQLVLLAVVFTVMRAADVVPASEALVVPLRYAGLAALGVAVLVSWTVRARIRPQKTGEDWAAWHADQKGRPLILWTVAEGTAVFGLVCWLLTGNLLLLGALTGWGFVSLLVNAPGRLTAG